MRCPRPCRCLNALTFLCSRLFERDVRTPCSPSAIMSLAVVLEDLDACHVPNFPLVSNKRPHASHAPRRIPHGPSHLCGCMSSKAAHTTALSQ